MNVYKGRMPTKIELTLEQSQQGVSNDVLVSIEGVEECDSDHAGCLDSRKSTSGGIQFLGGDKLVDGSLKNQDCTSCLQQRSRAAYSPSRAIHVQAFPVQAHRCQISLHKETDELEVLTLESA
ncbi:hypothetical protein Tco_0554067 [Tanacetum coccineum]